MDCGHLKALVARLYQALVHEDADLAVAVTREDEAGEIHTLALIIGMMHNDLPVADPTFESTCGDPAITVTVTRIDRVVLRRSRRH
ncbi:hypothetical protein ACFS07_10000 [Undibacterium arcticum]